MALNATHKVTLTACATALAVAILTHWEGMDLRAHHQAIDPPGVITACIGRTNYDDPGLKSGETFTREQCEELLRQDLPKYFAMLQSCIHVDLPPHRLASMLSFVYNVGQGTFCRSSVVGALNTGHVQAACNNLMRYTRANRRVLQGLKNRRRAERSWCLRED
jgi:lysozyme